MVIMNSVVSKRRPQRLLTKWADYSEVGYLDDLLTSPSVGVAETASNLSSKTHRTANSGVLKVSNHAIKSVSPAHRLMYIVILIVPESVLRYTPGKAGCGG
jgi:hypothetical protein